MKKIKFDLFRLSLRERTQKDMFVDLAKKSRQQWIETLFSTRAQFEYKGSTYIYIPTTSEHSSSFIFGRVGREVTEIENTSPEDGYQEIQRQTWKAADIIVDPTEHDDGQKVAIQLHDDLASPKTLSLQLLKALEAQQDLKHYLTSIHPITNSEAFWDFVERNNGKIKSIRFELEVPNMFGTEDQFDKEMKDFREREKAQKVIIEIKNPDGVDPYSERVRFTANKAMEQGTGKVTAKGLGKGNTFKSDTQQISSSIETNEHENELSIGHITTAEIEKILGRD